MSPTLIKVSKYLITYDSLYTDRLQQILLEVRSSNQALKEKVSELEKTVVLLQSTPSSRKKIKLTPPREERVSMRVCASILNY